MGDIKFACKWILQQCPHMKCIEEEHYVIALSAWHWIQFHDTLQHYRCMKVPNMHNNTRRKTAVFRCIRQEICKCKIFKRTQFSFYMNLNVLSVGNSKLINAHNLKQRREYYQWLWATLKVNIRVKEDSSRECSEYSSDRADVPYGDLLSSQLVTVPVFEWLWISCHYRMNKKSNK